MPADSPGSSRPLPLSSFVTCMVPAEITGAYAVICMLLSHVSSSAVMDAANSKRWSSGTELDTMKE